MASSKHRHEKVGKMGHMPGDIPRRDKIHMMEKGVDVAGTRNGVKLWRKEQQARAKVRVKRRLDREMKGELDT